MSYTEYARMWAKTLAYLNCGKIETAREGTEDQAMTTNTETTPKEQIEAWAQENGVTMSTQFVPFSQSRNKAEKSPSLNWVVTLSKNGREFWSGDYGAGCGHCPSYKQTAPDKYAVTDARRKVAAECEQGFKAAPYTSLGRVAVQMTRKPILPDLADVLSSLSMDGGAIDAGGFENWASDCGYDTDSRKAEAIYAACIETYTKMRGALGEDALEALREACQDY